MNKVLGGALLIAGTCIGAGMLALPVAMAPAGFYPSVALLGLCWFIMFYTGLLILEANINLPAGANFISMSKATLGKSGTVVTWFTYLLLLYSLMAAYLVGSGELLVTALHTLFKLQVHEWVGALLLIVVVGIFIYFGTKFVDYLGRIFMFGFRQIGGYTEAGVRSWILLGTG